MSIVRRAVAVPPAVRLALPALALAAGLCLPSSARAAEPPAAPATPAPAAAAPFEFERFQLVLLVRAPTWRKLPEEEAKALQAAHLAHLTAMWEAGKAAVCGPFGDQQDAALRGACIYDAKDAAEARALAEADPVVKAGQLRIEAVTWYVGKGHLAFPKRPAATK